MLVISRQGWDDAGAMYIENGHPVETVEPDIFFDDPPPECASESEVAKSVMAWFSVMLAWAGGNKARMCVIAKLAGSDQRSQREIASHYRLSKQAVSKAISDGESFLKNL